MPVCFDLAAYSVVKRAKGTCGASFESSLKIKTVSCLSLKIRAAMNGPQTHKAEEGRHSCKTMKIMGQMRVRFAEEHMRTEQSFCLVLHRSTFREYEGLHVGLGEINY